MKGDFHVRFCGKIGAKFPCLTRLAVSLWRPRPWNKQMII